MRYDQLAQSALKGVVREALRKVEKSGQLPGDHHFYIAFNTRYPGVDIGERLSKRYPREMTIVIQHQFWDLDVHDDYFQVKLNFDHITEKLVIPFAAVKGFLDPAVQFGLQFEVVPAAGEGEEQPARKPGRATRPVAKGKTPTTPAASEEKPATASEPAAEGGTPTEGAPPKVVSLDAFRKK